MVIATSSVLHAQCRWPSGSLVEGPSQRGSVPGSLQLELPLTGAIAVGLSWWYLETGDLDLGVEVVGYPAEQVGGQVVAYQLLAPRPFLLDGGEGWAVTDGEHCMVIVLDVELSSVDC